MSPTSLEHWIALMVVLLSHKHENDVIEIVDAEFDAMFLQASGPEDISDMTLSFQDRDHAINLARKILS